MISILRGHMPPALVVTAVTLVLGVLNFGVSFYSATYPGNVDLGKSFNYSLSPGQSSKVNISPAKGALYFGYIQKKGAVTGSKRTMYLAYYRPTTSSAWRPVCSWKKGMRTSKQLKFYPVKNKRANGKYLIDYVNGRNSYLFKWVMRSGKGKAKGTVDIMLD